MRSNCFSRVGVALSLSPSLLDSCRIFPPLFAHRRKIYCKILGQVFRQFDEESTFMPTNWFLFSPAFSLCASKATSPKHASLTLATHIARLGYKRNRTNSAVSRISWHLHKSPDELEAIYIYNVCWAYKRITPVFNQTTALFTRDLFEREREKESKNGVSPTEQFSIWRFFSSYFTGVFYYYFVRGIAETGAIYRCLVVCSSFLKFAK